MLALEVAKIKAGKPKHIREILNAKAIDVEFDDFQYVGDITVEGMVERHLNTLTFTGTINRLIDHTCGRCLKHVEENILQRVVYNYDVTGVEEVSMLEDVRDDLLLSHPERFVCDEKCKGLCHICGGDLNLSECKCNVDSKRKFDSIP